MIKLSIETTKASNGHLEHLIHKNSFSAILFAWINRDICLLYRLQIWKLIFFAWWHVSLTHRVICRLHIIRVWCLLFLDGLAYMPGNLTIKVRYFLTLSGYILAINMFSNRSLWKVSKSRRVSWFLLFLDFAYKILDYRWYFEAFIVFSLGVIIKPYWWGRWVNELLWALERRVGISARLRIQRTRPRLRRWGNLKQSKWLLVGSSSDRIETLKPEKGCLLVVLSAPFIWPFELLIWWILALILLHLHLLDNLLLLGVKYLGEPILWVNVGRMRPDSLFFTLPILFDVLEVGHAYQLDIGADVKRNMLWVCIHLCFLNLYV